MIYMITNLWECLATMDTMISFTPKMVPYFPMIAIREILITLAMFIKFLPSMHPHLHMIFIINYILIEKSLSL